MEPETEVLEPQNPPKGSVTTADEVTISPEEIEDLKRKAEASSQNFERLKKAEKRAQELEERLADLEINNAPSENYDDEIGKLRSELSEVKAKVTKGEVLEAYPELKDMWTDFESFREDPENKGMNMRTAAKAFLVDRGLLDAPRKGLEKPSGGPRTPIATGMTTEDVEHLRKTNYRKYSELIRKGQLKIS